jgi:hypothetical protein
VKINLAAFDLNEPTHVQRLGGMIGEAFGHEVLVPLLEHLPPAQRLEFFLAVLSYPTGVISGCLDAETVAKFFAKLKWLEASVRDNMAATGSTH